MKKVVVLIVSLCFIFTLTLFSSQPKNKVKYQPYKKDKVLKEIKKKREDVEDKREEETDKIQERNEDKEELEKENKRVLKSDMKGVYPPKSLQEFKQYFHFPPIPQYSTSTCWSFSATSYFESEIFRLTGKKIKLSEMWTPYYELLEKCRRHIKERGYSYVAGGGESNSVTRIWKQYGVVPAEAYPGIVNTNEKHDHVAMMEEIYLFLEYIDDKDLWDEENNLKQITVILDKYMGKPPEFITYNGKKMTPKEFLAAETGLNLEDYCSTMSTTYYPFYTKEELRAPDNWWFSKDYINLPLDVWYKVILKALKSGHTMIIGGDVLEPGKLGMKDIMFVPTCDIPAQYINQDSREYRIFNKTTKDDHGIHLVGYKRYKGQDWFLIKDSGRSSRKGKYKGYYFFRGDFVKLKMLTFTVHKDVIKDILEKIK